MRRIRIDGFMGTTTTTSVFPGRPAGDDRPEDTGRVCRSDRAIESRSVKVVCASIIIPTYCEADNLRPLCERIFATTRAAGMDVELLIVDDASPDATADVVAELARKYTIRLITRTNERGLSSAVVRGFQESSRDLLVCMDADLSHPPEKLVDVIMPVARDETDFCIGSRYVRGGRTSDDWGLFRRLNSKFATWLARPLIKAHDPLSGFFCVRRETFEKARRSGLAAIGYKIGLEICVRAQCRRVREVPIHFVDRCAGKSKLTLHQQMLYLRQLVHLFVSRRPLFLAGILSMSGIAIACIVWRITSLICS